jgi:LPS export ABC transporter protein LptC
MSPRLIAKLLAGFGIVALAVIVIVTVSVVRRRSPERNLDQLVGLVPDALLHARGFHWTQMKGPVKEWVLSARDASFSNDRQSALLTDAKVTMITTDGKHVVLESPTVRLHVTGNHINSADLGGGITVHYGDFVVTTESAEFFPDSDRLDAPGPVTVVGQGIKVTAVGLSGHPRQQQFTLNSAVNTEITRQNGSASPGKS